MTKIKLGVILPFLSILMTPGNVKAQTAIDIYVGFQKKQMKLAEVVGSEWLEEAQEVVEREHDFNENVSYVGEDWDDVAITCDMSDEQMEHAFDDYEVYQETQWKKIIETNSKKTVAYVLYLYADISWRDVSDGQYKSCLYRRGTYVVGRDQVEIDDSDLYNLFKLSFSSFL